MRLWLLSIPHLDLLIKLVLIRFVSRLPQRPGNDSNVRELVGQVPAVDLQTIPKIPVVIQVLEQDLQTSELNKADF